MQRLKLLLSGVLRGLQSMGRFLTLPEILGKGGKVMIMINALAYYDMAKSTSVKSFIVEAPGLIFASKARRA
jgi:hypothetical protein